MSSDACGDAGAAGGSKSSAFAGPNPRIHEEVNPENCIKILLATDNHIGYAETDPVRGMDSINTFREILQLAVANDVDMLLLGGDLFHENRPSRTSLFQTISALREYTMGPRPVSLELIADDGIGITRTATYPNINYEDENMNVGLPVFSIHGNHDDPQGTGAEGALCALDVLSASGLINYFGRLELPGSSIDDETARDSGLKVKPVLLQKGTSKLALYGMGNIRDERFHFEATHGRIKMYTPAEDPHDWFNILLVHQNRVAHGQGNHTSDTAFGEETDLVVWGHEHDCISEAAPCTVAGRKYYITQPGSSIATSLAKGESIPKHVSLLKIQGREFQMEPIRLRSVRPFVWDEVSLLVAQDVDNVELDTKVKVNRFLKLKVNELIEKANADWDALHPDEGERLAPLIRLRVDYSGGPSDGKAFEIGNPQRFGQDYVDLVANPRDIVQFYRKNTINRKSKVTIDQPEEDVDARDQPEKAEKIQVSHLVKQYLEAQNLGVLPEKAMGRAVEEYVEKGNKSALSDLLKSYLKEGRLKISANYEPSRDGPDHDDLESAMQTNKEAYDAQHEKPGKSHGKGKGKGQQQAGSDEDSDEEQDDEEAEEANDSMDDSAASSVPGTGKGKTKAAKAPPKKAPSKKKLIDNSDSSDLEVIDAPKKKAPAKKAPAKTPPARGKKAPVVESDSDDSMVEATPAPKKKRT